MENGRNEGRTILVTRAMGQQGGAVARERRTVHDPSGSLRPALPSLLRPFGSFRVTVP
jgi:hypothetical protein